MKRPRLNQVNSLIILVVLTLIVGAGNLWASHDYLRGYQAGQAKIQDSQRRQGEVIEQKLCSTFGKLAALAPPPGNPASNPSRAYLQDQHDILAGVAPDIGCPPK